MKNIVCLFLGIVSSFISMGQKKALDVNAQNGLYNVCVDERIKSISFYRAGDFRNPALIKLGTSDQLELHFDDLLYLDESERDFYYTITPATANWQDERLIINEYLDGFQDIDIRDYSHSVNTDITYTHYQVVFPNDEVRLKISGNYFIRVFDRSTRKQVFQRCFSVLEDLVSITSNIHLPLNGVQHAHQINFAINYSRLRVDDPFRNLTVSLKKNTVFELSEKVVPGFMQSGMIDYARPDKNIFMAGNEYRIFDSRNLSYNGPGVERVGLERGIAQVFLQEDESRDAGKYTYVKDINGLFMIGSDRSYNADLQSDYTNVHFRLKTNRDPDLKIYIFGALSNWCIDPEMLMTFNPDSQCFEANVLLKQAWYNYQYIIVNKDGSLDTSSLEGDFFDTRNNYAISVYFRPIGARYDRLVGYQFIDQN